MIFVDSSVLLKRYIQEPGSDLVAALMDEDPRWSASVLARTESAISLCRKPFVAGIRAERLKRLEDDWAYVLAIPLDGDCLARARTIGCDLGVRTFDAIHLAAASLVPGSPGFLTFGQRQAQAAVELGLPLIELTERPA